MSHVNFKKQIYHPVEFKKFPCPVSLFFKPMSHVTRPNNGTWRRVDFRGLGSLLCHSKREIQHSEPVSRISVCVHGHDQLTVVTSHSVRVTLTVRMHPLYQIV